METVQNGYCYFLLACITALKCGAHENYIDPTTHVSIEL
jgi:hypothetical protein